MNPILEMKGINKYFSGVHVLKDVDFIVYPGEVHGLMGENGAGKSTLIKILTGVYPKDSGEIIINGNAVDINNRNDSRNNGIAVIYQELSVIDTLTVAQNVFLGQEKTKGALLDEAVMNTEVQKLIDMYEFDLNAESLVASLSIAQKQVVEILKAVSTESDIIVMDEPTASLTAKECETLFSIINRLRERGKAIIYISHRIDEVEMIVDRLTVLRNGELVGVVDKGNINKTGIIRMMIGKEMKDTERTIHEPIPNGNLLEVADLSVGGLLRKVSFKAYGGQILGIGGLVGSGRTETLKSIFGMLKRDSGSIKLNGKELSQNPSKNSRMGIGLVPEDRRKEGFIPLLSMEKNIMLADYDQVSIANFFVKDRIAKKKALNEIDVVDVRPKIPQLPVMNLSGGNAQKVVIGKWLIRDDLKVLLVDEPTVGIDVGAKEQIYSILRKIADDGGIVIMVSSDLRELTTVSDRILVMVKGRIFTEFPGNDATQEDILSASYGMRKEAGDEK